MVKRSLRASPAGIQQAKCAFSLQGWTHKRLAEEVNLKTRQPIWRFFTGQPVDRHVFFAVCSILGLDWREIVLDSLVDCPELGVLTDSYSSKALNALVQQVRSAHHDTIQNQCGIVQLLDINRPIRLEDIYVDTNIWEDIASQKTVEIAHLQARSPAELHQAESSTVEQPCIPGLQAITSYAKVRILGQLGSGKTMFLQYLALQCDRGALMADYVPIFITLKEFVDEARRSGEFSFFNAIDRVLRISGIMNSAVLETLLQSGRVLLLIDGMDEVLNQDVADVIKEIRRFSDQYYKNRFVIACRTAVQTIQLRGFTDVEVAPLTQAQIKTFIQKWFAILTKVTTQSVQEQVNQLLQKLELSDPWRLSQIVANPLFLQLACWVFQRSGNMLTQRAEFYKQGVELLLGKWDAIKGVERDRVDCRLLFPQKLRLLSQFAAFVFEREQYLFAQREIEHYIGDYLHNQLGVTLEPEELQLESELILQAIARQNGLLIERSRGIFSFPHLAFQEYLTAHKIVANSHPEALEQGLKDLVCHITEPRWREVFLLTATMLRSPDLLVQLMKHQIDIFVEQNPDLKDFLYWVRQQSSRRSTAPKHESELDQKAIARDRHSPVPWHFTPEQQQVLQRYHTASQLLVDCLYHNGAATAAMPPDIEALVLLTHQEVGNP